MKTGKRLKLSETPNSNENTERVVKFANEHKHKKRKTRIKRNSNLEHDNTRSDDMFNRERLDESLRSIKMKENDLRYTRRYMYTSCHQRSLHFCIKVCHKINYNVCNSYGCSPIFKKLAKEECESLCQEEHINGTKYSDSYDNYITLDAEDYYDDHRGIIENLDSRQRN